MKLYDTAQLAWIKLRSRKIRSAFAIAGIAFGTIIIISSLMVSEAITSIAKTVIPSIEAEHYYTEERIQPGTRTTTKEYRDDHRDEGVVNVFEKLYTQQQFWLEGLEPPTDDAEFDAVSPRYALQASMAVTEKVFLQDYLFPGESLDSANDGVVPVIVPESFFFAETNDWRELEPQERYKEKRATLQKSIGKEFELIEYHFADGEALNINEGVIELPGGGVEVLEGAIRQNEEEPERERIGVRVRVVGFTSSGLLSPVINDIIQMPISALQKADLQQVFDRQPSDAPSQSMIAEFETLAARDEFIERSDFKAYPHEGPAAFVQDIASVIRSGARYLGGAIFVGALIDIILVVGKVVSDSKKEIGVFRAIGASKGDIRMIYIGFASLLVLFGIASGLLVTVILGTIFSITHGETLFYAVAGLGATSAIEQPTLIFLRLPALELIIAIAVILVAGFLIVWIPATRAARVDPVNALRSE